MQVRRNSHLNCFNSVAMGFPVGLIVENDKGSQTQTAASEDVAPRQFLVWYNRLSKKRFSITLKRFFLLL